MAGRIVVLEFKDKVAYDAWRTDEGRTDDVIDQWGKVLGTFLLPTQFCKCIRPGKGDKAEARDWKMHSKYRIHVCKHCGRPSQYWVKGILVRLGIALGKNLDEPDPKA